MKCTAQEQLSAKGIIIKKGQTFTMNDSVKIRKHLKLKTIKVSKKDFEAVMSEELTDREKAIAEKEAIAKKNTAILKKAQKDAEKAQAVEEVEEEESEEEEADDEDEESEEEADESEEETEETDSEETPETGAGAQ